LLGSNEPQIFTSSHGIVPDDGQQAAMQDAELLAKHASDNQQRFDQNREVGHVLDKLLDSFDGKADVAESASP
jgi:hypothetical protein